jgi:hypothetical protein
MGHWERAAYERVFVYVRRECFVVSRECPHGSGVESNSRRRSQNDGDTRANWLTPGKYVAQARAGAWL